MVFFNIFINNWILIGRVKDIDKRLSKMELLEYFKNNIEIREEKEENTLQKKDKSV
jgi:hypothetical protein